jgi:hypothetical protein
MTVQLPRGFGLIVRKGHRTLPFVTEVEQAEPQASINIPGNTFNEDDDLVGLSLSLRASGLDLFVAQLEKFGAVRGRDFVATASAKGLLDPQPDWLEVTLGPTGNPPELEAKMEPAVRAMWEATRKPQFRLSKRQLSSEEQ